MRGRLRHVPRVAAALAVMLELATGRAEAQTAPSSRDAEIKALQEQLKHFEKALEALSAREAEDAAQAKAAQAEAAQAKAEAAQAKAEAAQARAESAQAQAQAQTSVTEAGAAQAQANAAQATAAAAAAHTGTAALDQNGHGFLEHKKGDALTFYTPGGEITGYGNIDVSVDYVAKTVNHLPSVNDTHPVGNFNWQPDVSTNNAFLGVRGFQDLPGQPFRFVYQFEAGIDVSAFAGNKESGSSESNQVNGALFSRNSYIGLANPSWGAIKVGKSDAPYKNSTASLNPFAGELGDYAVVMGNTGGDNRVEFGTRLSHAIWYESPVFAGGFTFNALYAPGQNRSSDSDNLAAGESDCAGTDIPESGGDVPFACNDGAFSDAASMNLAYTSGRFYATVAGEYHNKVNRQSDITAVFGAGSVAALTPGELHQFTQDVADEWAAKAALQYTFPTDTMVGGIVEYLRRDVPSDLDFQNERTRFGTWLVVGQKITSADNVFFGWAHAFHTPGDPGQHNDSSLVTADGVGAFAPNHNSADMLTLAWKHLLSPNLTWYADWATTINGPNAHYDLGAGGRSVTTDCHDAFSTSGGAFSTPRCWTGTTLMGVSTGLKWTF